MNVKKLILGGEDYPGIPQSGYYDWLRGAFPHFPRRAKVDNNTWLDVHNPGTEQEIITVTLHQTPIITADQAQVVVKVGKWHSDVTADRLNNWLPSFRVYRSAKLNQLCWDVEREATPGQHPMQSRWRRRQTTAAGNEVRLTDGDSIDYLEGILHTQNVGRVEEGKKNKKPWDSMKGIMADYSRWPEIKFYRRCAKCGTVHGMFDTVADAQMQNYCHSCRLGYMDKLSKEVAKLTGRA
jgi:hypothetical protein